MVGVDVSFWEPDPGDNCDYEVGQKIKRRYTLAPCGEPAITVVQIGGRDQRKAKLCRVCVGRIIREFVSVLVYIDNPPKEADTCV